MVYPHDRVGDDMPAPVKLLVVSQHAEAFRQLLHNAALPNLEVRAAPDPAQALPHCDAAQVLFGAPDMLVPLLDHCPHLQWVQSSWAGIRPLIDAPRRDYRLTGVRDIFGRTMAEYVLAWILAFRRDVLSRANARHWDDSPNGSVQGQIIGIAGTGSIGAEVARFCQSFGMQTRGLNTAGTPTENFDRCYDSSSITTFATHLDYLVALLPDTPDTDGIINHSVLDALNPGAVLINAGRGNSIHYPDMFRALQRGQLGRAVLDVFPEEPLPQSDPLWQMENVTITSHTAAPTSTTAIVDIFCQNYSRFQAGDVLLNEIDFNQGY
ncbi:D-2-hydroxyacid dehydrogenase [Halieaceae bacterium IMCC14734]|uniref:D-2-hydroxyacid dehydrogenase n=1 Tax=Candidatus Litorirhabdus singularis TaxID=2518993 RepID=A0ABT3THX9_9GAMM|nr:D-2-hydroxyacid dehydrogenase [Candidatus Litorirhabdus singularis]MCX2981903.1 D-2-hydroxyacid dehydrogenase [Candidatus Litorirhabdus singularis]